MNAHSLHYASSPTGTFVPVTTGIVCFSLREEPSCQREEGLGVFFFPALSLRSNTYGRHLWKPPRKYYLERILQSPPRRPAYFSKSETETYLNSWVY